MIIHLSILLSGFSIIASLILLVAYLGFLPNMRKSLEGKIACAALLLGLALLQLAHYAYFANDVSLLDFRSYGALLMIIPAAFYFFSRVILLPEATMRISDLAHAIPSLSALALPISVLPPLAFLVGTVYTFWFVRLVFNLRNQSGRFKFELFFFGLFALMAFAALILGLSLPYLDPAVFYHSYANSISIAMLLIVASLIFFPELLSDILLIAELNYAQSKLENVDVDLKLHELERLMNIDKHFQNEDLNIGQLADQLELSSHQLSELVNTHYGFGFPRFMREQRVREAKRLLVAEPDASILSISMQVGFKSQSNFYTAFKEISKQSPGSYRKKHS
jgi:AraC-like DNA-binding protein